MGAALRKGGRGGPLSPVLEGAAGGDGGRGRGWDRQATNAWLRRGCVGWAAPARGHGEGAPGTAAWRAGGRATRAPHARGARPHDKTGPAAAGRRPSWRDRRKGDAGGRPTQRCAKRQAGSRGGAGARKLPERGAGRKRAGGSARRAPVRASTLPQHKAGEGGAAVGAQVGRGRQQQVLHVFSDHRSRERSVMEAAGDRT